MPLTAVPTGASHTLLATRRMVSPGQRPRAAPICG